ncbi:sulfatase-like hydrolase/transferase [Saliphagus sp. LR7]|uniref:sulfatase-like hydrolase/transferase n=1 Tax=Saliphagus sp. LR7 TaxID=2282654 RepID=UPI000DF7DDBE|nr:sulfatase-like hydrolase/transferase [Saliphagus sp. LR7]
MTSNTPTGVENAGIAGDGTVSGDSPGDRPNLLLVCVDCLRQDLVITDRTETPFLDDLRERGTECTSMYATATTTTPAVASLLTGSYAERNGIHSLRRGRLAEGVDFLPEVLGERGWHTEGMVTGPLVPETGLDRGFDAYRCRGEDESVFGAWRERATARLGALPEPFAAVVHLWELHEDVIVPSAYDRKGYGGTPYERALSALDREIEALVDSVPDDTVVAVVGDHGESITHRHNPLRLAAKSVRDALKYYGGIDTRRAVRRINRRLEDLGPDVADHFLENGHGENVFDFTTNVPFILAGPGVEPATVDAQVRAIDVLPTVLSALGVEPAGDGEAIRPREGVTDRPAYLRACGASLRGERNWARAVRDGDAKLVTYPGREWPPELYDLEADPRELSPVDDPETEARLAELLPERGVDPTDVEDLEIDDHLRALGYR